MSLIQDDIITVAYKKLKQMVYYEKTQLFLRKRLAEFECADDFRERLDRLKKIVMSDSPTESAEFQDWLKEIDFVLLPKGVKTNEPPPKDQGKFITNVTSQDSYEIEKVNYMFDGPIEIHLIAVLWLMVEGPKLDEGLARNCMGSRLHHLVGQDGDHSAQLFQKYHELYSKWRDDGIKKASDMLTEEKRSVCIIALDVQEYYYRVRLDWKALRSAITRPQKTGGIEDFFEQREHLGKGLFDCLESIFHAYQQRISKSLVTTHHPQLPDSATCLPIGLCASPVIANWYLKEFDEAILKKVRPAYYGRYIDDILLVVASESVPQKDPILGFMDEVLVNAGILKWHEDSQRYELCARPGLFLQKKKCILQFFEAGHTIAGLEKFKKELQENASDFALLPVEGDDSPVEQVAYDLLYDGSANKLRSIKAIAENRWELAMHLAKQTQMYLVAGGSIDLQATQELFRFFKGRNAIDYWDMWERVVCFLVITGNSKGVDEFTNAIKGEVNRIRFSKSDDISRRLRVALKDHLELSLQLSKAIRENQENRNSTSGLWRSSNLIRHHLVAVPLLNYTNYRGDLAVPGDFTETKLVEGMIDLSPRYVHFDECVGFVDSGFAVIVEQDSVAAANHIYAKFHGAPFDEIKSELVGRKPAKGK